MKTLLTIILTGFIGLSMPMFVQAQTMTFAQCADPPTRVKTVDRKDELWNRLKHLSNL